MVVDINRARNRGTGLIEEKRQFTFGTELSKGAISLFEPETISDQVSYSILATTEWVGNIFRMPKAGTISHAWVGTTSTLGPLYEVRVETVAASVVALSQPPLPSGTLFAAGARADLPTDGIYSYYVPLDTPPTVAANDIVAGVIRYVSGTLDIHHFGDWIYANEVSDRSPLAESIGFPMCFRGDTSSGLFYQAYGLPFMTLLYNDNTPCFGPIPAIPFQTQDDFEFLKGHFLCPFECYLEGVR